MIVSDSILNRQLRLQCADGLWAGGCDPERSDHGMDGVGKSEWRWDKNGGSQGVSLGVGPERLAERLGVRQHWGMGRRGVSSNVRLRRQLVNGRIRTQLLT